MDDAETPTAKGAADGKSAALKACVQRMREQALSGKARDDAAGHFLAGAAAAADGLGFDLGIQPADTIKYVDVLEQLASAD